MGGGGNPPTNEVPDVKDLIQEIIGIRPSPLLPVSAPRRTAEVKKRGRVEVFR